MIDLQPFFNQYGDLFIQAIKQTLLEKQYPHAPGKFGNAYNKGRNPAFQGQSPINATGGLVQSVEGYYDVDKEAYVIFMASYWRYVNDGREPGKRPPTSALTGWITKRFGLTGKELDRAAFGIATNIGKFGVRPTNFYDDAGIKIEDIIAQDFPDEADELIETLYDNLIKKIKK